MKKITLSFSILALAAMFTIGCKKTAAVAPVADTELQTSIDASWALFTITDAEMIGAFISDNSLNPTFYLASPISSGSTTPVQDTLGDDISFGFNQTTCVDGNYREGTIDINRAIYTHRIYTQYANSNSRYYRTLGYSEQLFLLEYKVNDWKVFTVNADNTSEDQGCIVVNNLTSANWNPATTKLSWNIQGNFRLKNGTDSMFCKVNLVKTLTNTNDVSVFAANKQSPINWSKAIVSYSGEMSGYTVGHVPFTMIIKPEQAIIRQFTCSPNLVASVTASGNGTLVAKSSEYHPFVDGIATFSTAALYPRQIYYGGSEASATPACDNSGAVLIKGISYPIDFRTK
jgi:hypothetical protein